MAVKLKMLCLYVCWTGDDSVYDVPLRLLAIRCFSYCLHFTCLVFCSKETHLLLVK